MGLGVAIGHGPDAWVEAIGGAAVAVADTALVGDRDHAETSAAGLPDPSALGLMHLPIERARELGPTAVGVGALEAMEVGGPGAFWLHLDVDVLDMAVFPATDYLDPDGMSWAELSELLVPLGRAEGLAGASLGCFNPEKDPVGSCGAALADLLEHVLVG
jgi:arginase